VFGQSAEEEERTLADDEDEEEEAPDIVMTWNMAKYLPEDGSIQVSKFPSFVRILVPTFPKVCVRIRLTGINLHLNVQV
jgi:hypothetical protein